jgi:CBS domain-containing protein
MGEGVEIRMVTAQDILDKDIIKRDTNDILSQVMNLFNDTDAIVITDHEKYQGMLLQRTLLDPKITLKTKLHTFLSHTPKLSPDTPVEEIARAMIENHVYTLPVLENDAIVGVVTAENVVKTLTVQNLGSQPIKTIMCTQPLSVNPEDTVGKVLHLFQHENTSYLAVVDDNNVVGAIAINTIINKVVHAHSNVEGRSDVESEQRQKLNLPAKTIMQEQPLLIPPETSIKDAHAKMHKFEQPGILIGKDNHLYGIVTHQELLAPYGGFEKEETIEIQFHHNNDKVEGFNKQEAADVLRGEFLKNYEKYLEVGYLHVTLEQHKETKQGLHRVVCEMKLSGRPGIFYTTSEGYGPMQAIGNAYRAIEHQINKTKNT